MTKMSNSERNKLFRVSLSQWARPTLHRRQHVLLQYGSLVSASMFDLGAKTTNETLQFGQPHEQPHQPRSRADKVTMDFDLIAVFDIELEDTNQQSY